MASFTIRDVPDAFFKDVSRSNGTNQVATIPAGRVVDMLSVMVHLETTGSGGQRAVTYEVRSHLGHLMYSNTAKVKQNTMSTVDYTFCQGAFNETSLSDNNTVVCMLPTSLLLIDGDAIKVFDANEVDTVSDSMIVRYLAKITVN
jgi:hypothetical protein